VDGGVRPATRSGAAHRGGPQGHRTGGPGAGRAIAAGGGFEPRLLLGNALHWAGRAEEGATELADLAALARTDAERVEVAIPRMFTLAWLGRIDEAEATVAAVTNALSDDAAALVLAGGLSMLNAFGGRIAPAAEAAVGVLGHPRCPPPAGRARSGLASVPRAVPGHSRNRGRGHQCDARGGSGLPRAGQNCGAVVSAVLGQWCGHRHGGLHTAGGPARRPGHGRRRPCGPASPR